jgi:uncharacterized membrane protein YeaQ/YmgE (transglycosylase-associated protein family)
MLTIVLAWLVTGLVIGGLAHLLVPGGNRQGGGAGCAGSGTA